LGMQSRAQVHQAFMQAMTDPLPSAAGLPPRVVVFGISSLPLSTLEALAAVAKVSQVVVAVTNPCQAYWGDVRPQRAIAPWGLSPSALRLAAPRWQALANAAPDADSPTESDATTPADVEHGHPLLAAWGQQVRDQLHLIDVFDEHPQSRVEAFVDPAKPGPACQLHQLQSDILHLRPPSETHHRREPRDTSIQWVQCHSAQREVEVLHDQVLAWLQHDPSLVPRDIMVMVPDMSHFAPHIHAVFGRTQPGHPLHIPYSVADQTDATHAWLQALDQLLQWPQWRMSLADWQALFEIEAIRQAFGLRSDDLDTLTDWLHASGVRWGMDAQHRQQWGMTPTLPDADHNSWAFGLRRLLLGYASGTDDHGDPWLQTWGNTVPTPGVGGLDAALISRLLDWLQAMADWGDTMGQAHTPAQWQAVLAALLKRFFKPSQEAEERLLERLHAGLADWVGLCTQARLDTPVPAVVVREHWLQNIATPGLHQRFLGEGVQFATLMPMRSVPFRVVALLGMNDGDYPRVRAPRDFDLMANPAWRRMGDRSRREDDRYLFLEALLSARERLYISWQAWRTHDHQPLPPSVLVGQLRDHMRQNWDSEAPIQGMPLQAFSPRYFLPDSPFTTFDTDWAHAAQAQHSPSLALTTEPAATPVVPTASTAAQGRVGAAKDSATQEHDLARWHGMLRQPLSVYYQDRLRIHFDAPETEIDSEESFGMNPLQMHQALTSLLRRTGAAAEGLQRSGFLPLAGFGDIALGELQTQLEALRAHTLGLRAQHPQPWATPAVDVDLGGCGQLSGEFDPHEWWSDQQQRVLHIEYSPSKLLRKTAAKEPLRARLHKLTRCWLQHLVLCASGWEGTSVVVGLDAMASWPSLAPETAHRQLQALAALYQQAWDMPIPIACQTAGEWLATMQAFAPGDASALALADRHARSVFEDHVGSGAHWPGEHTLSPVLRRHWDHFAQLQPHLPIWSERFYGPVLSDLTLTRHPTVEET
jgi:exodeoxyribonuclease V gamma subunit